MDLAALKKQYELLAKKYQLPDFQQLNEQFEIDKIDKETDCVLRLIRKVMMEKIVNSLGFLEMLFNPVNAPRLYIPYMKALGSADRARIDTIYQVLGKLSISILTAELDYSEKLEASLIKQIYSAWENCKPDFREVLIAMQRPTNALGKKEKSYLG